MSCESQQLSSGLLVVYYFCIIYGNFFLYKYLEKHTENNKAVKEADKKKDRKRNIIPARSSFHCALLLVTSFMVYSIVYSIPVLYPGIEDILLFHSNVAAQEFRCLQSSVHPRRVQWPLSLHPGPLLSSVRGSLNTKKTQISHTAVDQNVKL